MTKTHALTDWQMLCLEDAVNSQICSHNIDADSGEALLNILRNAKSITVKTAA